MALKKKLIFVVIENTPYLFDQETRKVYSCAPPHKCLGRVIEKSNGDVSVQIQ